MSKITRFFLASEENNYRPIALSYKAFICYGILLLILRLLLGAIPADGAGVESNLLMKLVNEERKNRRLSTLVTHKSLVKAAGQKTQDMIDRDYFGHIDPSGKYIWGKISAAGYPSHKILGENLALDFATAEGMIKAWLDSPTHRANLLHKDFVHQGLDARYGDFQNRYTNLTASLFGTPFSTKIRKTADIQEEDTEVNNVEDLTSEVVSSPQNPLPEKTPISPRSEEPVANKMTGLTISRIIFTVFGLILLVILAVDAVIIYKKDHSPGRSHSIYHLFNLIAIILVSILIWWW